MLDLARRNQVLVTLEPRFLYTVARTVVKIGDLARQPLVAGNEITTKLRR